MNLGRTVFAQVMAHVPVYEFDKCVRRYGGDSRNRGFSCWDQFLCLSFAQLTYRESLRDIQACLRSVQGKLYHMGFRGRVSKSTLSDANEVHDWRIYADFAQLLIAAARPMYSNESLGFVRGSIPTFIEVSDGKYPDVHILDEIVPEAGSFYVIDRGYIDFERLHMFQSCGAFFVTRTKSNVLLRRRCSRAVDFTTGLLSDHTVVLTTADSFKHYPDVLRRVRYHDPEQDRTFLFLTNNFDLPALTIAQLYKSRWKVELFFKWIKQHLRIKAFYGNSENAVKTQIWTAIAIYVLVAILKKRLALDVSLYQILQVLIDWICSGRT